MGGISSNPITDKRQKIRLFREQLPNKSVHNAFCLRKEDREHKYFLNFENCLVTVMDTDDVNVNIASVLVQQLQS